MNRRAFLQSSSAFAIQSLGLAGCSDWKRQPAAAANTTAPNLTSALPFYDAPGPIIPIRADLDRIFRITVCLRPFRAAGRARAWSELVTKLSCTTTGMVGVAGPSPGVPPM